MYSENENIFGRTTRAQCISELAPPTTRSIHRNSTSRVNVNNRNTSVRSLTLGKQTKQTERNPIKNSYLHQELNYHLYSINKLQRILNFRNTLVYVLFNVLKSNKVLLVEIIIPQHFDKKAVVKLDLFDLQFKDWAYFNTALLLDENKLKRPPPFLGNSI